MSTTVLKPAADSATKRSTSRQSARLAPRVAIVVDHPNRDLPGLVLVAWQLCRQGVRCDLVPMNLCHDEIWRLAPDFVLVNYLREHNAPYYEMLAEDGIGIGALDTEGGVFESLDTLGNLLVRDDRIRASVRCYCCWGPRVADYLVSRQISDYAAPYDNNLVLLNSNFTQDNPGHCTIERQLDETVEVLGLDRDDARHKQQTNLESVRQFAALANRLARRFSVRSDRTSRNGFSPRCAYRPVRECLFGITALVTGRKIAES